MKISKAQKKLLKRLTFLPLIFIVSTLADTSRNLEFTRIVGAVSAKSNLSQCQISIEIRRNLPFSFAPTGAKLVIKSASKEFETYLSRYKLPDRKFLKNHNTEYQFNWDGSIMAVELTPEFNLDKLSIENCSEGECMFTGQVLSCAA